MDQAVFDADDLGHGLGISRFTARQGRRNGRHGQDPVPQSLVSRIGQEGAVDAAGKADDDTAHVL